MVTPPLAACDEAAPPPQVVTFVTSVEVKTRDEVVTASVPSDLYLTRHQRSLFGTSSDGAFRLFIEHRDDQTLPVVLGTLKDELIGLGWEPTDERHFENAVYVEMARGPRLQRLRRASWIIEGSRSTERPSIGIEGSRSTERPSTGVEGSRSTERPSTGVPPAQGRVLLCEGIAAPAQAGRLASLRELCQSLKVAP